MESKILINADRCIGCGKCASVCIRDNLEIVDRKVREIGRNCFYCFQCIAVCPKGAIHVKSEPGFEGEPVHKDPVVSYPDMMQFLKERRSIRWFTDEKVTRDEFEKMFEAARYSPTSMHRQDVEFVVVDQRLDEFMKMVYEVLKPIEGMYSRIGDFCRYMEGTYSNPKGHPFLWTGRQLILTFSEVAVDSMIAATRVELAGYTMGLGGFYSLFMITAAERDPQRFSEFFKDIDPKKKLRCVYIIGHPNVKYKRTLPPRNLVTRYY